MAQSTAYLQKLLTEINGKLAEADGIIRELVRDKVLIPEVNQLATAASAVRTTSLFVLYEGDGK